jgi:hypothetical protein
MNLWSPGDISTALSARLSIGAQIYLPGSDQFTLATARWSAFEAPSSTMVVKVATARDVGETAINA